MTQATGDQSAPPHSPALRFAARLHLLILLPAFALLLLGILWWAVLYHISAEREDTINQAFSKSRALVQTLEERTVSTLRQIEQASLFLKYEFEQRQKNFALAEFTKRNGLLPTEIALFIGISDRDGKIVASSQPFGPTDMVDSESFNAHAERDSGQLSIGKMRFDRRSGKWLIPMTRRLNRSDGSLAGILTMSVDPVYFTNFYKTAEFGRHGSVTLLGIDGVIRARRIGEQVFYDDRRDFSSWLKSAQASKLVDLLVADSPFDRMRRIFSYRRLGKFPLVAVVGIAEEEALAAFQHRQSVYLLSGAAGSAVILAFVALLMFQSDHLRKSAIAAKDVQAVFRAAAEGSLDAFYIFKSLRGLDHQIQDFVFIDMNEHGAQLIGQTKAELVGRKLCEVLPASRSSGVLEKYVKVVASGQPLEEEFESSMPEIQAHWLRHQVVPIGDGVAVTTRNITARKQAEMETRNNRAFLQSLIDHLPVLIYVRDARPDNPGRMIVWNKAAEVVTGYPIGEVLSKVDKEVFPPRMVELFDEFETKMRNDPMVLDIPEIAFRRCDGGQRFMHIISVPLFNDDNQLEYILGIAEDITSRRQQDLELRTKQAELTAANDASPLGLFRTGARGDCTYVNRTYEEMSGLSRDQALGDGWARAIHPEDRLKVFQAWGQSARRQQPYQGVYRFRHAGGRIVWVSVQTAPILLDGVAQGYVGSVDDITARREAEQALRASEARLRTITDTLPAMVAYIDANERYRFNNVAYERAFGISREAMRDKSIREILGETAYARVEPYVRRTLNGEMLTFEMDEQRDDHYSCAEITYIPQFSDDGAQVVGFHVMNQDITAKKLEEKRLVQLAQIDSLTGLANRAGFQQQLADAMAHSQTSHTLIAVMYLDIDHFKPVNDSYGHEVGDILLKAFALRLSHTLRSTDTIARLGGDEFTIIMEELTKPEDAVTVAAKIVSAMQAPFLLDKVSASISVSIGLAFYQGGILEPKALIKQADEMLYRAKEGGRNTYRVAPFAVH